jgi:hypothetical protein
MNLGEIGLENVDWIDVTPDRDWWQDLVNTVMNRQVPQKVGNFVTM